MPKVDFKREFKQYYSASAKRVAEVDVPAMRYLMIDGRGDPNTSADYAAAVEALFSVSYTAKFDLKRQDVNKNFAVMPLEGLWWADDWSAFTFENRSAWRWTMMILQPPLLQYETIERAIGTVRRKKQLPALDRLRLETFTEGRAAQVLHVGPFADEGPTIERLHAFILESGKLAGKHHEIYLSDVRRAQPAKWKTIIRQPMA
ncbi:MAG: GyrI-like domain-containing protein [Tepidisphaeraceae bacterium]